MHPPVELVIKGIQCDSCDFKDPEVKVEDYPNWLNKPCPTCGENLLTQADFDNVQILLKSVELANKDFKPSQNNEPKIGGQIKMNGTGSMDFDFRTIFPNTKGGAK